MNQPSSISESSELQNFYEQYIGVGVAHKDAPNSKFRNPSNCLDKTKSKHILLVDGPNMTKDTADMGNLLDGISGSGEPESKSEDVFGDNDSADNSLKIDDEFQDASDKSFENDTVADSQPTISKDEEQEQKPKVELKEEKVFVQNVPKKKAKYDVKEEVEEEEEAELGLRSMDITTSTECSQSSIPSAKRAKVEESEDFEEKIKVEKDKDEEIIDEKSSSIVNGSSRMVSTSSQLSTSRPSRFANQSRSNSPIEHANVNLSEELQELLDEFAATKTCFDPDLSKPQLIDWIAGKTEYYKHIFPTEVWQNWFCSRRSEGSQESKPRLCPDIKRLFDCYEIHWSNGYHALETLIYDIHAINIKRRGRLHALYSYFEEQKDCGKAEETLELFRYIVDLSEQSDSLPSKIPRLVKNRPGSVTFTRKQCSIILANMFLGICPKQNSFFHIFSSDKNVGLEKVKFIMTYFETIRNAEENESKLTEKVTFRRTKSDPKSSWELKNNESKINDLVFHVSTGLKIEHAHGCSQMDFANKYIGGGVLNEGAVQEEIRFLMCPEMMISMLLCEIMEDGESIRIVGAKTYSSYEGYSDNLIWVPLHEIDAKLNNNQDKHGRYINELIAVDAIDYRGKSSLCQFNVYSINREINKLLAGFTAPRYCSKNPPITTGWWGCGAFRGNKELKAMQQVLAATITKRPLIFCTFEDRRLAIKLNNIVGILKSNNCTAGMLYEMLLSYKNWQHCKEASLFDYISGIFKK